ncbi:MAG: Fur family transcriptional regulator [Spiribacter sp.]|nr:Fur family transcriptional regulator [Spiribacter sp.]MDR9489835.1 Fur family transcriptional regulator [Spiribacter sp.]
MNTHTQSGRHDTYLRDLLQQAGLRATRQRLGLAELIFGHGERHLTAEGLYAEATEAGLRLSQTTVYNTLHQFTEGGLLREILADPRRIYFDTNVDPHHHFLDEETGDMEDIPADGIAVSALPTPPPGKTIEGVDVIVRVRRPA